MFINNRPRFGIVQGRLIQSPLDQLQWFPQEYWQSEFFLASSLGIDYIELIAERNHNSANPLWTDKGISQIKALVQRNRLSLYALCNDYIVDHSLAKSAEVLDQNLLLIERGALLGCKKYVLPLFEKSELNSDNVMEYIFPLRIIAEKAAEFGITVCLETVLNGVELMEILCKIDHPAVAVVYDTGNRIAYGHDLSKDIRLLGKRINHFHIKDKNRANENVLLGTGLVNFLQVFEALAHINYSGAYTFETNRGSNPILTAKYNINFVDFFYSESLSK